MVQVGAAAFVAPNTVVTFPWPSVVRYRVLAVPDVGATAMSDPSGPSV
jgi:hypothetical protein